eukprot:COSAG01_NODE_13995_length_1509_cov_1.997163_1_plen_137_part_00
MHQFLVGAGLRAGDQDAADARDVPSLTEAELEAATRYRDMQTEDTDGTSPRFPYPPSFIDVRNTRGGIDCEDYAIKKCTQSASCVSQKAKWINFGSQPHRGRGRPCSFKTVHDMSQRGIFFLRSGETDVRCHSWCS